MALGAWSVADRCQREARVLRRPYFETVFGLAHDGKVDVALHSKTGPLGGIERVVSGNVEAGLLVEAASWHAGMITDLADGDVKT